MYLLKSKHKPAQNQKSTLTLNPVVMAVAHIGQARLLLHQESRELLSRRDAHCLRNIADALGGIIGPMQRIGRAMRPETQSDSAAGAL
jgi:hypothetical protein